MGLALRARGMQRLEAGDAAAFPGSCGPGWRPPGPGGTGAGLQAVDAALDCEHVLLAGLAEWLDRADGGPALLREVGADLARHEADMPVGADDTFWAEQVILRNTMDRIGSWLPRRARPQIRPAGRARRAGGGGGRAGGLRLAHPVGAGPPRAAPAAPVGRAGRAPAWLSALPPARPVADAGGPGDAAGRRRPPRHHPPPVRPPRGGVAVVRAGARPPAPDLAALVPAYLPAVPEDPYTGRPFGYRVSAGEPIAAGSVQLGRDDQVAYGVVAALAHPVGGLNGLSVLVRGNAPPQPRGLGQIGPPVTLYQAVPAGYAILWSAGPDGRDDGGRRTGPRGLPAFAGDDWVVLVRPTRPRGESSGGRAHPASERASNSFTRRANPAGSFNFDPSAITACS